MLVCTFAVEAHKGKQIGHFYFPEFPDNWQKKEQIDSVLVIILLNLYT